MSRVKVQPQRESSISVRQVLIAATLVIVAWAIWVISSEASSGNLMGRKIAALSVQNAALSATIAADQRELSASGSTAWLEERARMLGFVAPGERVYIIGSGTSVTHGGVPIAPLPSWELQPGASPSPSPAPSSAPTASTAPLVSPTP